MDLKHAAAKNSHLVFAHHSGLAFASVYARAIMRIMLISRDFLVNASHEIR